MTDKSQVDAMENILGKLGQIESGETPSKTPKQPGQHEDPTSKAAQTEAMASVLEKLQAASGSAAQEIVTESQNEPDLGFAVQAERTETGVTVSKYDIRAEKKTVNEGLKKTFYNVIDNRSGDIIYEDLGLFESAMGIVKHLLYTKNNNKLNRLVDLDREYVSSVLETHGHKHRLGRMNESSTKYDVTSAKYSNAKSRMQAAKVKILKAL